VDTCATKYMSVNHASMVVFSELTPHFIQERIKFNQEQEKALEQAVADAASADAPPADATHTDVTPPDV